jgi:Fe-S-cluster containining protein
MHLSLFALHGSQLVDLRFTKNGAAVMLCSLFRQRDQIRKRKHMERPTAMSMSTSDSQSSPCTWTLEQLTRNLKDRLHQLVSENLSSLPTQRLFLQVEQDTAYQEIVKRWPKMDDLERLAAWKRLFECVSKHSQEVLPYCVRCGDCCRKSSPTLHLEDLELLQNNRIPWNLLDTLRRGEPVQSPFEEKLFFLLDERIKIREKDGSQECVLLDGNGSGCLIYDNRPLQCRAQACWDEEPAKQLSKQAYLTRRDIFQDVELLLELIAEHDQRCSFDQLQGAFQQLQADSGESINALLELLRYEEHFRTFLAEQLNIPADTLNLIFGRSYAELVPLFGFRVEVDADGTRRLVPDAPSGDDATPNR